MNTYQMTFSYKRHDRTDTYEFTKDWEGWLFKGPMIGGGKTDKFWWLINTQQNRIYLHPESDVYRNFEQDSVIFPMHFGWLLGYIHDRISRDSNEVIQTLFEELGNYLTLINQNWPEWDFKPERDYYDPNNPFYSEE